MKDQLYLEVSPLFVGESYPLLAFGHVRSSLDSSLRDSDWRKKKPVEIIYVEEASQCILSLCEREVSIKTEEGSAHSTLSSPNYGNLFWHNGTICWQPEENMVDDPGNDGPPSDGHIKLDVFMDQSMRSFGPVLGYSLDISPYFIVNDTVDVTGLTVVDESDKLGDDSLLFHGNTPIINIVGGKSTRSLEERLESVATALTNYGLETTNNTVPGRAFAEESYVKVRWQWIILPVLLQLSTLVLFIMTVVYSHLNGVPIWKSSILAIIYHAVEDLDEKKDVAAERLSGMDAIAQVDKVQFSRDADGVHHLYGKSHR